MRGKNTPILGNGSGTGKLPSKVVVLFQWSTLTGTNLSKILSVELACDTFFSRSTLWSIIVCYTKLKDAENNIISLTNHQKPAKHEFYSGVMLRKIAITTG